jgi:uncharacterized protein (TIGR02271 family)
MANRGHDYGYESIPDDLDALQNLSDWEIADGEPDPRGFDVIGADGEKIGTIENLLASPTTERVYFAIVNTGGWFNNKQFALPMRDLRFDTDRGQAYGPYTRAQFEAAPEYVEGTRDYNRYYGYWTGPSMAGAHEGSVEGTTVGRETERRIEAGAGELRVPVTEETAEVHKERREAGFITLRKRVETETQHISEPVMHTRVVAETREVPAGEQYAYDADATTLREGEELRVPIVEEELIVEKRPRVTKEVVVRTQAETEQVERDVELRREEVEVEEEGDVDVERPARRR